jgi:hypothetical protein
LTHRKGQQTRPGPKIKPIVTLLGPKKKSILTLPRPKRKHIKTLPGSKKEPIKTLPVPQKEPIKTLQEHKKESSFKKKCRIKKIFSNNLLLLFQQQLHQELPTKLQPQLLQPNYRRDKSSRSKDTC